MLAVAGIDRLRAPKSGDACWQRSANSNKQDRSGLLVGQTGCNHATRRAGTTDHEIEVPITQMIYASIAYRCSE